MTVTANGGGGPKENPQNNVITQVVEKAKSALSEIAQFVKPYLDEVTMAMRDAGLVERANKLISSRTPSTAPEAIDFMTACQEVKGKVIELLRAKNGPDPKGEAVVSNYFSKFLGTFPSESPAVPQPASTSTQDSLTS